MPIKFKGIGTLLKYLYKTQYMRIGTFSKYLYTKLVKLKDIYGDATFTTAVIPFFNLDLMEVTNNNGEFITKINDFTCQIIGYAFIIILTLGLCVHNLQKNRKLTNRKQIMK